MPLTGAVLTHLDQPAATGGSVGHNHLLFYLASHSWVQFTEPLTIVLSNEDGAKRIRTADPLNAIQVLYQLSYSPLRAKRIINTRLKDAQASTPNFPLFG